MMTSELYRKKLEEAAGLTVADVVHRKFSALPADATIGAVREWFAASTSRRMAFLADGERYLGSLTPVDVDGDRDPTAPAADGSTDGGDGNTLGSDTNRFSVPWTR